MEDTSCGRLLGQYLVKEKFSVWGWILFAGLYET